MNLRKRLKNLAVRLFRPLLCSVAVVHISACSSTVQWDEEVLLNDGRKIVVTQVRRCEGGNAHAKTGASCVMREAWATFRLPEFSNQEIVWHESLNPMILNTSKGRLYIVGFPPHTLEFRAYGAKNPPYVGFLWDGGAFKRIAFTDIPIEIYATNMLIESVPEKRREFLTLQAKNAPDENGAETKPAYLHYVDPKFAMPEY